MLGWALDADQVAAYDRDGALVVPGRVSPALLALLDRDTRGWIAEGIAAGPAHPRRGDFHCEVPSERESLFRVDYVLDKPGDAALALLGSPAILGAAQSLCGPGLVPTYEVLVFKRAGAGAAIPWHRDTISTRAGRMVVVDVYLDPSRDGQGGLRVVPGSHRAEVDLDRLAARHGWDAPGHVAPTLAPGDLLLHDPMVVHGSPPATGNALRRTLYLEFRPAELILAEGPWDLDWIRRRRSLLREAIAAHARLFPGESRHALEVDVRLDADVSGTVDRRVEHPTHPPRPTARAMWRAAERR